MPRDIVILSPIQPDAADLSHVAAKIDATLRASDLANGAITQLLTADGQAVLTVTLNAASHVK
ncbi:MAG: hypothetical protein FWF36_05155, partial [Propionibacteriaceae bacterium]|nr:hypothetical protein [Propionibacteriaceae bacterium]